MSIIIFGSKQTTSNTSACDIFSEVPDCSCAEGNFRILIIEWELFNFGAA